MFSVPVFSSFYSSGTPITQMVVHLILSQRSLRLSSILFFFLYCSSAVISTILSSSSLIHSSASDILLLIPSGVFLVSVIVLFVSLCLFFISSRSLLIDSCIFSLLFLTFWIIFAFIIPTSFSDSLPISSSFIWPCVSLSCSFVQYFSVFLLLLFKNLLLKPPLPRLHSQILSSC